MGGRGSSSASSRSASPRSASDAADLRQLSEYMMRRHGVAVDPSVGALDFETVRQGLQGVENVLNEFPQMAGVIRSVRYDPSTKAYAYASYGSNGHGGLEARISMSGYFSNPQDLSKSLASDGSFHPKNSNAMQVMAHEAGHALETAMANKASSNIWEAFDTRRKRKQATSVISRACREVKKTPYGRGKRNEDLVSAVSGYARRNRSEALAECVGDYVANGAKSNPLSQAVWGILKAEMG